MIIGLENIISKMSLAQKVIIGISVGLILLVITIAIAEVVDCWNAFHLEDTWFIWIIFLAVVGYFEYKLFS
jgi:hypothetical protein